MKTAVVLLLVLLGGCVSLQPTVTSSNARSVLVHVVNNDMRGAQRLADVECAKASRIARLRGPTDSDGTDWMYDCVE